MKLVGRIPVEPLDDERWTNIERNVVAEATNVSERATTESDPGGGGVLRWALAAIALALVVLGAGAIGWRVRGASQATRGGEGNELLALRTDRERSMLDIGDATIASDPGAVFAVTRPSGGVLVAMTRGKVELEVDKRGTRPPLVVRAGETDVIVVGTHFTVDYGDGSGDVDVRVTEGVVKVVRHHKETRVAAGQSWTSKRRAVAAQPPRAGDGSVPSPSASSNTSTSTSTGTGTGGPSVADDVAIDTTKSPDVQDERTVRAPDVAVESDAGNGSARKPAGDPGTGRLDRPDDPQLDLKTQIRGAPLLPPLAIDASDPKAQIAEYTRIFASDRGQRAAYAMYSIAVVKSRQGQAGEALETIDRLVKRFEGFDFREPYTAALWLRVRIRCLAAIDDACRHAAYIYVHQAKDGSSTELAEQITLAR